MKATYLIRFDDICPEMNWENWERIEKILNENCIKPILAVIPANSDPTLKVDSARENFWDSVRAWQSRGWSIGLHGYTHIYETENPGLIGLNSRSEFAGLQLEVQQAKIDSGLKIFGNENVRVDAWIAPGHSFDMNTIAALSIRNINVISDGHFSRIVRHLGMIWVPQQLWRFVGKNAGVWTICYHHNKWTSSDIDQFERDIRLFRSRISSLDKVLSNERIPDISIADKLFSTVWRAKLLVMHKLATLFRKSLIAGGLLRVIASRRRA